MNAVKSLATSAMNKGELANLTEEDFNKYLSLGSLGIPDPDVLEDGGEQD